MRPADKDDPDHGSNIEGRGSPEINLEKPDQSGRLVVKDGRGRLPWLCGSLRAKVSIAMVQNSTSALSK